VKKLILILALALIPSANSSYIVSTGIQYGTGSQGQALLLDAYPAPAPGGRSVIMVHGGAWVGGGRAEMRPKQSCKALQLRRVACFSIDYELAPESRWPTQLQNMRDALTWVQQNATTYNGDDTDVSVWGQSAGAHLALMLAFDAPGVESVVGWSSPTDFTTWGRRHAINLLGCEYRNCPDKARAASSLYQAHVQSPPILLAHALSDPSVPYSQSSALAERLSTLGVSHRLDTYPGTNHGGGLFTEAFEDSYGWWEGG
jgi:acetyl esterase/lipase